MTASRRAAAADHLGLPLLGGLPPLSDPAMLPVVGVVDTGVDGLHPDLETALAGVRDRDGGRPRDTIGHGTAVAGMVAGDGTCGLRVGVSPGAPLRVAVGWAYPGTVVDSMGKAVAEVLAAGADVVVVSASMPNMDSRLSPVWTEAATTLARGGNLLVATAPAGGADFPAALAARLPDQVLPVGPVSAPPRLGVAVCDLMYQCLRAGGEYSTAAGISLAAPLVAAAICRLAQAQGCRPAELWAQVRRSAPQERDRSRCAFHNPHMLTGRAFDRHAG